MSYPILPSLPLSMAKGLKKAPVFNTVVQKVAAGRGNSSTSLTPYATWDFEFDLDRITGNEAAAASALASFFGTFMACNGSAQLFLFTDPQDSAVVYTTSGMLNVTPGAVVPMGVTGDGTSTQFQLARSIGGLAWDVIQNCNGAPTIKVGGVTKTAGTDYSISSTGVVTFVSAPANAATLTWQGSFYYLCRFSEDTVDASRVFTVNSGTDQWDIASVKFSSEFV
jgi:uncharacterized protein (TIGR02217 family)